MGRVPTLPLLVASPSASPLPTAVVSVSSRLSSLLAWPVPTVPLASTVVVATASTTVATSTVPSVVPTSTVIATAVTTLQDHPQGLPCQPVRGCQHLHGQALQVEHPRALLRGCLPQHRRLLRRRPQVANNNIRYSGHCSAAHQRAGGCRA